MMRYLLAICFFVVLTSSLIKCDFLANIAGPLVTKLGASLLAPVKGAATGLIEYVTGTGQPPVPPPPPGYPATPGYTPGAVYPAGGHQQAYVPMPQQSRGSPVPAYYPRKPMRKSMGGTSILSKETNEESNGMDSREQEVKKE